MGPTWGTLVLFGFGIVVLLPSQSRADELMQKVFLDTKCNICQEISVLRIETFNTTAVATKGEEDKEDSGTMHDLSAPREFHDAELLDKFQPKEIAHTPHHGETSTTKHPLTFKAPAEELTQQREPKN